jgi:hypothetical protein
MCTFVLLKWYIMWTSHRNVAEDAGHLGYVMLCYVASSCRHFQGSECLHLASQAVKEECISQDCLSPKMKAL